MVAVTPPSPRSAAAYALRLGCLSFGGPAGQIALISREVVDEHRWIDAATFSRALNLAMLLPGPEALQTVIYVGWRLYGVPGGIVAGLAFLGPGAAMLVALSWLYVRFGGLPSVAGGLIGLKSVVVAVIVLALCALARSLLRSRRDGAIALIAFGLVAVAHLSCATALAFGAAVALVGAAPPTTHRPAQRGSRSHVYRYKVLAWGVLLWLLPFEVVHQLAPASIAEQLYVALSRVALGGFGGAYAVVTWVGQLFVQDHHWVSVADLTAGIGLAETTPGPLVLVLQFYGYVAGWLAATPERAGSMALACAILASWATFLPSFVLVLGLAPEVESLVSRPRIAQALAGVGAAVVGVIATFAFGVGRAVLVPDARVDTVALGIATAAGLLLGRRWLGLPATIALGVAAGWWLR
jgi:chromate transporter